MNKWSDMWYVDKVHYQKDWGDHPQTGDWTFAWGIYENTTGKLISRRYSRQVDAKVGAALLFNSMQKQIENVLLG